MSFPAREARTVLIPDQAAMSVAAFARYISRPEHPLSPTHTVHPSATSSTSFAQAAATRRVAGI